MESRKFTLKKVVATVLLAPPTLTLIGFSWTFGNKIIAAIDRSKDNKAEIQEVKKEIREIHWYLIKRNNVQVPPTIHKGVRP